VDTYEIRRDAPSGRYLIFNSREELVATKDTRAEAMREIARVQNEEIYEGMLRRAVRLEFTRATEDMFMNEKRALEIMQDELNQIAHPATKTPLSVIHEMRDAEDFTSCVLPRSCS